MKNQKLILVGLGALLTTALFYRESWGVNILLFSLVVTVLQFISKKDLIQNKAWLLVSFGTFLAGLGFNFTNSAFAAILYVASMVVSVYLHQTKEAFWPLAPLHTFLNLVIRPFDWIFDSKFLNQTKPIEPLENTSNEEAVSVVQKEPFPLRLILIPGLLFIAFIVIYGLANQGFGEMIDAILKVISIALLVFLAVSFIAMITLLDSRENLQITEITTYFKNAWSLALDIKSNEIRPLEVKQKEAIISFVGLIGLLLVMLGFEIYGLLYPQIEKGLAEGVHENIYAVIGSIVLAALATIYYFSGNVFFMTKIELIKKLAYFWIGLNAVLATIGFYKTAHYIHQFGLTYKRLCVFEYLTTILTGLIIIAWCIHTRKGNWKLVNLTIGFTYSYLILFNLPSWDRVMVHSNYVRFEKHHPADLERLSVSGFAEFKRFNRPESQYPDPNKYSKVQEFQQKFRDNGFLSKTFEDYRINEDLLNQKDKL